MLILLVLACLLPGVVGAAALFIHEYHQGREQLERDTVQTARALMQAVDNEIQRVQALAQGLAVTGTLASGELADFHGQARQALEQSGLGATVTLSDRSGRVVLNTGEVFGRPLRPQAATATIDRVFATGAPIVSNLYQSVVLHRPLMSVAVPVIHKGEIAYALTVSLLPEAFNSILRDQGLPEDWVATVFDGAATIAASSRDAVRFEGKKPSSGFLRRFQQSHEGSFDAGMNDGDAVRVVHTRSPVTGWRVAIAIPSGTLRSQFIDNFARLGAGIAALFLLGVALAWLMGGKIARSFHALVGPATALGAGEAVTLPRGDVKEAAELAQALEKAAGLLTERTAKLVEANAILKEKGRELAEAHNLAKLGTWHWNLETGRITASDSVRRIIGQDVPPFAEQKGHLLTPESWERANAAVEQVAETGGFDLELEVHRADGTRLWVNAVSEAIRDDSGQVVALRGTVQDISERKLAERRIREAALHDPLTGLPNRGLIFEYGNHLLAAARRSHARGALLFIDLDRFKAINDLYGHEVGDGVLEEVGRRLVACTRQEDVVGRLGGDEFVILLPHLDVGRHRAAIVAQHVVESVSRPIRIGALELSLSPSIGISYYPEHANDVGALIHAADLAMYQVKQSGRANYHFFTPELDRRAEEAYSLEARLRRALKSGGLALHYQPVVDIPSERLIGVEALLRLEDGDRREAGPGSFIPIAESCGLIGDLGEWVAVEACRQHEAWLAEGLRVPIAVNVSPLQFRQPDFAARLRGILADIGLAPECLQLEVTESTVMESVDDAVKILGRIKSLGIKIALDDFGTGYSSLSRLSSLPLDKLKVDQSFVQRIASDRASRAVTEVIIALGRSLKLEVIGEGIESADTLRYLRQHGCNQAQGFWFSPPLPPAELAKWYRQRYPSS